MPAVPPRRSVLLASGLLFVLGVTLILTKPSDPTPSSSSSSGWWSKFGMDIPTWSGTSRLTTSPYWDSQRTGSGECVSEGATTLENAFVPIDAEGNFAGKETRFLRGIPGYSLFENVYTVSGLMIAITSDPSQLPPVTKVLSDMSKGTPKNMFPIADESRWLVLTPEQAVGKLDGRLAARLVGPTIFINDGPGPEGYLAHYFHMAAELFAGAWRVLAASPEMLKKGTVAGMEFPRRVILAKGQDWRDVPGLNAWFFATMFPMMAVEDSMQWNDRSRSENLYIFDQVVILDRWASHRHNPTTMAWNKMNGDVFRAVEAPADWWSPVRDSMMLNLGIEDSVDKKKAVVVYISRQGAAKRRLTPKAHDALVSAIRSLPNVDLHVPQMELLSKRDQMDIVTKADVVIGVHGNGLTNAIWMKPGGAVIELFDTGGFTRDYQLLTEPLNHVYYPIWNDKVYDWAADVPGFKLSDNFQGTDLEVSASLVKGLIANLLEQKLVDPNRQTSPSGERGLDA